MANLPTSPEVFNENIHLKENIDKLKLYKERRENHPSLAIRENVEDDIGKKQHREKHSSIDMGETSETIADAILSRLHGSPDKISSKQKISSFVKYLLLILVVAVFLAILAYMAFQLKENSDRTASLASSSSPEALVGDSAGSAGNPLIGNFNLDVRYPLKECQVSKVSQTFPDIDYAMLGYNVLRGYPLAVGHDPGFTYPVFVADYFAGGQTADCRYSVPEGLVVIPDVSCVTSFSSTIVQTRYELSKSLSVSAEVHGSGWGVSFSASTGYKESSSQISTGEYVYILSTANCNYYFSKLITDNAPRFDETFLKWTYKLNGTNLMQTYFDFFDIYGTHFPTEVMFGARYTFEYKMESNKFESQQEKGVNVAAQASYSGIFNVGGGFNLDSSRKESASDFSKSVQTKTITVGAAPPSNGDAMTWASEVQSSPVPTSYKLSSIELLFTDSYMGHLNIDHYSIGMNIQKYKYTYCQFLKSNGEVESCDAVTPGILLKNTRLFHDYQEVLVSSVSDCIENCLQQIQCEAITYCKTCLDDSRDVRTCFLFKDKGFSPTADTTSHNDDEWQSNIFQGKIKTQLHFVNTSIVGSPRGFENDEDNNASSSRCHELCNNDAHCVAFSHCDCPLKTSQCQLYSEKQVLGLKKEPGTNTYFISSRLNSLTTSTSATTTLNTSAPVTNDTTSAPANNDTTTN